MNNLDDDLTARVRHGLNRGAAPELSSDVITGAADHPAPRMTNPARLAGGATVLVAAAAVAALVVAPSLQPAPLFTAAGASAPSALGSAEATSSSDMRMAMWVDYRYTAGEGLSTSGGNGSVYELVRAGDPQTRASEIASIFGVEGSPEPAEYSDPAYPVWIIGPEDGSAPTVSVTWAGAGDWWYSDPAASPIYGCVPIDANDLTCVGVEQPPAVSAAPSDAEARALAMELFGSSGFEVTEQDIEITSDEWQTTAAAHLVVDGITTALDWGVTWANTGAISWAYGHSITVKDRGTFGTVSAFDAVDRLKDGRWYGAAGPDYQGGAIAFAADSARSASSGSGPGLVDPTTAPEAGSEPGAEPTTEPGPVVDPAPVVDPGTGVTPGISPEPTTPAEPGPVVDPPLEPTLEPYVPEVVEVTVDEAESTLLLMWDTAGNAWLVPGFAMLMPEGWWSCVVSLVPGVIQIPEPIAVEPYTTEVIEPAVP